MANTFFFRYVNILIAELHLNSQVTGAARARQNWPLVKIAGFSDVRRIEWKSFYIIIKSATPQYVSWYIALSSVPEYLVSGSS